MPSLTIIKILADMKFISNNKKLPIDWKSPAGDPGAGHYDMAFDASEKSAAPAPMCYFFAATPNKYHVDAAKTIGGNFKDFCHKALDAIKNGVDMWRLQAKFKDLKVMSVSAIGAPGCLDGPELKDLIVLVGVNDNEKAYAKAVKEGVSECWKKWQDKVMVPGLPWYPAFAAFPSAMAPPMPNVPTPLIACPSAMMSQMGPSSLKSAMCDKLDGKVKDEDKDKQYEALFDAIGTAVAIAFLMWLPMQQVMLVLGKGPIPSFAPPYVPVGPVVGGDNIAAPGHLMA